jgi:hypothetical protein
VHYPGSETTCIVFLKQNFEQSVEATRFPNLQSGSTFLHLEFRDFDLFPVICADLVQTPADNTNGAQARIRNFLIERESSRPLLVAGLLLQPEPHNVNWQIAIDSAVNHIAPTRDTLVAICNHAFDTPLADEDKDRWRTLTGVYGRYKSLPRNQEGLPASRSVHSGALVGSVLRDTRPGIFAGPIKWPPYGPVVGKFYWHASMGAICDDEGIRAPVSPPLGKPALEFRRFTQRHPSRVDWCPCVSNGLNIVREHLELGNAPNAEKILRHALHGVAADRELDADEMHSVSDSLRTATYALATLITFDEFGWQTLPGIDGQLAATNTSLLIWRDPERNAQQMRRGLGEWILRPGPHPKLIVLGEAKYTLFEDGPVKPERRDDISVAPPGDSDFGAVGGLSAEVADISQPHMLRTAVCVRIDHVASFYSDYDEGQFAIRRSALLSKLGLSVMAQG